MLHEDCNGKPSRKELIMMMMVMMVNAAIIPLLLLQLTWKRGGGVCIFSGKKKPGELHFPVP